MSLVVKKLKALIFVRTTWPNSEVELDGIPYKYLISKVVNSQEEAEREIRRACELPVVSHALGLGLVKFAFGEDDGEILNIRQYELVVENPTSGVIS